MAVTNQRVDELVIRAKAEGFDQTKAALDGLAQSHGRAGAAADANAKIQEQVGRAMRNPTAAFDELTRKLEGSPAAWKALERNLRVVSRAADEGRSDLNALSAATDKVLREFQRAVAPKLSVDFDLTPLRAAVGQAKTFDDQMRGTLRAMLKDAEATEAALRDQAKATEDLERRARSMREAMDPLAAAQRQMNEGIAEANALRSAGAATDEEVIRRTAQLGEEYRKTAQSLGVANDNVKLTSGQVQNLGYQLNDATTMLLSGSSPFQVLATQGGQVVQILQENGGIGTSLKAMAMSFLGLLTPLNLAVTGFVALGAAAVYFGMKGRDKVVPLTDAMSAHKNAMDAVAGSYGLAAVEAEKFQRASTDAAAFSARQSRAQLEISARTNLREAFSPGLTDAFTGSQIYGGRIGGEGRAAVQITEDFKKFEAPLLRLLDGLAEGTARADLFVDEIAKIANLDRGNEELQKAAKRLMDLAGSAAEAQRQLYGVGPAFARAARDAKQFNDLATELGGFVPNQLTDAQRIEQTYAQMMRLAKTEADITRAQDLRRLSLNGLADAETRRRAGHELDLRSIAALSAAERAQIEYERAYNDALSDNAGATRAAQLGEEARALSLTQSSHDLTQAMQERVDAGQAQVDQLRFELSLVGQSAGATSRLRAEYDMLAAAREAARNAGGVVDPAEEAAIRAQAAEIGNLTDQMARLDLERDQAEQMRMLQAEAGLIGMNEDARRSALAALEAEAELRRQGIDLNGEWGRTYVSNARQISDMETALDRQKDAFEGLREAAQGFFEALGSGDTLLDALSGAFARFGQSMASGGFDKVFNGLFGKGGAAAPGIPQIAAPIAQPAPSYSSGSLGQSFAAPIGAVDRAPLPPLVTGEGFSASRAATVASQSVPARVWNFFAGKGLAPHQIAGIMGNAKAESGFNYAADTGDGGNAWGLFQWNDRRHNMVANVGQDWRSDLNGQMEFAWKELQTSEGKAYRALLKATDVVSATEAFLGFERPSGYPSGVRNSHNYSGRVQFAQEAYREYGKGLPEPAVMSPRVYERATATGVKTGLVEARREQGSIEGYGSGQFDASSPNTAPSSSGFFGPRFGAGLNVLGAGAGAFFGGMQSGSPLGGLVSGGFGGFQAAGSIASAFPGLAGIAGPLGAVGGAALGLIGGILGARKQREQQHQEKAARWEQMRPQYEAFDQSLSGDTQGGLRTWITDQWNQLSQYMDVGGAAWKKGTGNSTAQFRSTGSKMFERFHEMIREFQDGYVSMIHDMESGEGLQGAFAKGRNATKDLKAQIQATRDDIDIAFGNVASIGFLNTPEAAAQAKASEEARAIAIERYNKAAGEYALSLMFTSVQVSDVRKTIDGFRGTAAGLHDVFADLGWSAEDAAAAINDRLNQAIANVAKGLNEGIRDRIEALAGVGYFAEVRAFLAEFDTLKADVAAAGADPSQLSDLFSRELQAIVDGAELTGSAFTDLVAMFPQLAGVVREFTATAIVASAEEIADAIKGYRERLFQAQNAGDELALFDRRAAQERIEAARFGADGVAALEAALAAERLNIVRSQAQAMAASRYEAAVQARADAESALRTEYQRTVDYVAGLRDFLRDMRLDENTSTLSGQARFDEAQATFRDLLFKANGGDRDAQDQLLAASQDYLDQAKAYWASSETYGDVFREVESALKASASKAETQLDVVKRQASSLLDIAENTKGLSALLKEYLAASKEAGKAFEGVNANRNWGANPERNKLMVRDASAIGLTYTGNFGSGGWSAWLNGLPPVERAKVEAIQNRYAGMGYSSGGFTGTGDKNEVAGFVHRNEVVWSEDNVRAWGGPAKVEAMRTSRVPDPYPASSNRAAMPSGSDSLLAEVRLMRAEIERLRTSNARGHIDNIQATREGTDAVRNLVEQEKRRSAA